MHITKNILQRTFQCVFFGEQGTCFTVDHDNQQYIVTAKHLAAPMREGTPATIQIMHEQDWKDCTVNLVGHCEGNIDISVLAAEMQLSPAHPLPLTSANMILGQDVYLLGFPQGLGTEVGELNQGFPIPIVKRAILSTMERSIGIYLLDGYVTRGFSGGPVAFRSFVEPDTMCSVCAVIGSYKYDIVPVYENELLQRETGNVVKHNAGLAVGYDIRYAVDAIGQNPIGFNLQ